MFQRMLQAFGVGGPTVDTVLDTPHVVPGGMVSGQVRVQGGTADAVIEQIVVSLVTRVEHEGGGHEVSGTAELVRLPVSGRLAVPAGRPLRVPFQMALPWETPLTAVGGSPLYGMSVGVRTELVIAGAPDPGDLDLVSVQPLGSQARVLDAFARLGFRFRSADVETGRLHGVPQQLGLFQEIEFLPPPHFAHLVQEVELTFVATPHELYIVLEADRRGGVFGGGGDTFGHFVLPHGEAERADWAASIGAWVEELGRRGHGHRTSHGFAGAGHGYGGHGYDGHDRHHGSGLGGAVLGAAAGVAGGMLIGGMLDDVFDGDDDGGFFDV